MDTANLAGAAAVEAAPDERLRAAVARARRSTFYAQHLAGHDVSSRADLERLPLTFKHHLRDASPFGVLAVPPSKVWHYHESSGTTGEPISTWAGLEELRAMAGVICRMVPELAADTILLNRFPLFAPVSFVFEEVLRQAGACHIPAGNMSWDVPFSRALEFICRLRVTALSSLPLEPVLLREVALEKGMDLRRECASLKVIFCGGAVLPPALRRAIEQDWNARVVEIYGSNETLLLGVSCVNGQLHLLPDFHAVEVLDPQTYAPVAPGECGVLTVTGLIHKAMPLVRYFTGDLVRLRPDPCACGQPGPTADVLGRFDEVIRIGNATATSHDVLDAAYTFADGLGTRIFFILIRPRGLQVLLELPDRSEARDPAGERRLAERIGLPVTVEYLRRNDVLDRSAMFRGPKIYKPGVISDWRGPGRKPITIMEALLEWPHFDARTLLHLGLRQLRNVRRRRRLLREDRQQ